MPSSSENKEDTKRTLEDLVADQDMNPDESESLSSLSDLPMNGSADLEAPNITLSKTESRLDKLEAKLLAGDEEFKSLEEKLSACDERFKSLEGKLSACDEKLNALEAERGKRWVNIFPNYVMVFLTLGSVFTGVLMWYLSKGTSDKTLARTEEVIKNGFRTLNNFLSMYLSIANDRTREGTTTLIGSLSQVPKNLEGATTMFQ